MRKRRFIILTMLFLATFVMVSAACAADSIQNVNKINDQPAAASQPTSLFVSFIKLVFVLGIIIAAAWTIIRLFTRQYNAKMQGTWMHIVDEVMLGQNRGVVLCEVGGKVYALGVTDKEINLLFEVDNPKLMEEISTGNYNSNLDNQDFWPAWVTQLAGQIPIRKKNETPMKFQNVLQEQSQRIKELATRNTTPKGPAVKRSDEDD